MRTGFPLSSVLGLALVLASWAGAAHPAPLVAVDVDPATPGIQGLLRVALGAEIRVDVVVEGVEPSATVSAYEADVDFPPAVLEALDVVSGGFLPSPALAFGPDIDPPDVNFNEFSLAGTGNSGAGTLFRMRFRAIRVGTAALDLNDVILTSPRDPTPGGIPLAGLRDAAVQVAPCGDLDLDEALTAADVRLLREHLAGLPPGLSVQGLARCSVIGGAGDCDVRTVVVLRRALGASARPPEPAPVCAVASAP